jgi:hypothetical protein
MSKDNYDKHWWQRPWTRGFTTLGNIVTFTVGAGTLLMLVSIFVPRPDATKDVLPFATGLIGFLGGLVTAMYNRRDESSPPGGPTEPDIRT